MIPFPPPWIPPPPPPEGEPATPRPPLSRAWVIAFRVIMTVLVLSFVLALLALWYFLQMLSHGLGPI